MLQRRKPLPKSDKPKRKPTKNAVMTAAIAAYSWLRKRNDVRCFALKVGRENYAVMIEPFSDGETYSVRVFDLKGKSVNAGLVVGVRNAQA